MREIRLRRSVIGVALGIVSCGGSSNDAAHAFGGNSSKSPSSGGNTGGATGSTVDSNGSSAYQTGGTADGYGGASSSGFTTPTGGVNASGGSNASSAAMGGNLAAGGVAAGSSVTGGKSGTGGSASGGIATGGKSAAGGGSVGGNSVTGSAATNGGTASGGNSGVGGAPTGGTSTASGGSTGGALGTSTATTDQCSATNPLSNGTPHCGQSLSESYGSYEWQLWSNQPNACLTTYAGEGSAFSVKWDNSMDVLARVGLAFDGTKTHQEIGAISAEFSETHNGSAGEFSYIGVYGWMATPTVEYYIVEDSFDALPFRPIAAAKLITFQVDGGSYDVYSAKIPGTGDITQVFSVRQSSRHCGHVSVSEHFSQWADLGVALGKLQETSVFVEAGGGQGSIDFTTTSVVVN